MEVSKEILDVWRNFTINGTYEGELMKLVEKSDLNYKTVQKAIAKGKCSAKVHNAINAAASEIIREIQESKDKLLETVNINAE